ncbi:MAG: hypothetical protein ACKPB8_18250 [Alphaproteobacteria bacterium]
MDGIGATVLSLAMGAASIAGKDIVSSLVKDGYAQLKALILQRYPKASIDSLEQAPDSKARRAVLEEDLEKAGAAQDSELVALAKSLLEAIQEHAPAAASAMGVDLKDIHAANLRLADIEASGSGVKVEAGRFTGDIDIRNVKAGFSGKPGSWN